MMKIAQGVARKMAMDNEKLAMRNAVAAHDTGSAYMHQPRASRPALSKTAMQAGPRFWEHGDVDAPDDEAPPAYVA